MFERFKSREALHKTIETNRKKAKHYGERMSALKSYNQDYLGLNTCQVNNELEKCSRKMQRCEKRIQAAERCL